ncbi:MAG: FAD/NAD(P)-binding protein [Burkholderiaceae bacterium]
MSSPPIEADYLVIGAGATAMAFVDTLLSESDASVALVDRHHRPGGHWNDAYPFVRLHQPSAFYGVASRELSSWTKDAAGLNKGLYGLASGTEVLSHFDQVMQERFVPSGRVRWVPMSEYRAGPEGTHHLWSLTHGDSLQAVVRKKVVDATHAQTAVPSTHAPKYTLAAGVNCVPLNRLPDVRRPPAGYTVVGSGKTGMDACLWLLQNGGAPSRIRWIRPRDAWLLDRANAQPGADDFEHNIGSTIGQFEAIAAATSLPDLFVRLEQRGLLLRIDPSVQPSTYRCAVVSQAELAQLQRIEDVVRLGHVRGIEPTRIVLDQGALPADADTLYVDCSAAAIQMPPAVPVFDGARINLLMVRWCQPLFSAALIAWVESHVSDPARMNALCTVVPSPEKPSDWLPMWAVTLANGARWREHAELNAWLMQCRLNSVVAMMRGVKPDDAAKFALIKESGHKAGAALARIPALLAASG